MSIVYLNGHYLPVEQAKISVFDRGFLFGDGLYEVISIYHGKLFRPHEHLNRLNENLKAIELPLEVSDREWLAISDELIKQNHVSGEDKAIYWQVTRGVDVKRDHAFPKSVSPTIFVMLMDFHRFAYDDLKHGFSAITREDTRWECCHIKSLNLLPNVLDVEEAKKHHVLETILIRDGYALEAARSNLFIVKHHTLITPPTGQHILGGITRDVVLELARANRIPIQCRPILREELFDADEVWVTSSVLEICPITVIDGKAIHNKEVGPLWHTMIKHFLAYIEKL